MATRKPRVKPPVMVTVEMDNHVSKYDLEGSEDAVVQAIRDVFAQARNSRKYVEGGELYLDWRPRRWEEGDDLYMYMKRPETDKERDKRIAEEKAVEEQQEAHQRRMYEQLHKKFGGK